jgi:hypothetical protein
MKKIIASGLIAASALALSAGAASAQPHRGGWTPINVRQDQLDRRIDRGVETGQLSRREARRLRGEFRSIARLEARYRSNGLSAWERNDLDRRFDALASRIRYERHDRDYGYGYGR